MMYVIEYKYSAIGGSDGFLKWDLCKSKTELKQKLVERQQSARSSDITVVELEEKRRYKATAEVVIKESPRPE